MIKQFLIITCLFTCSLTADCQFDTAFAKKNILRCADSLADAFRSKSWEKFTRYSYPPLVGKMGGQKEFIAYIDEAFRQLPDSAWKKYEPGNVLQVVKTSTDLQAIVELHSEIVSQGMKIFTTSYLVAESWNGGQHWTFFDSQNDPVTARSIKHNLSDRLIIPPKNEKIE